MEGAPKSKFTRMARVLPNNEKSFALMKEEEAKEAAEREKEQGFSVCFNYLTSSLLVRHIMLHDWCKLGFKIYLAKSSISILVLVVWVVNIVRIKGERKYLGSE